jgi:hypothetical protein
MVTLVGCAISYISLFWCPIIYLDYFWYIKYQHISIYMKMGKRNGKRKRKRNFFSGGPGERFSAQPGAGHARERAPAQLRPTGRETARARGSDGVTAGPTRQRERRGETAPRVDGAGEPVVRREKTRLPVGSTAIRRRWPGSWSTGRWLSTGRGWRS